MPSTTSVSVPTEPLDAALAQDRRLRDLLGQMAGAPRVAVEELLAEDARLNELALELGLSVLAAARLAPSVAAPVPAPTPTPAAPPPAPVTADEIEAFKKRWASKKTLKEEFDEMVAQAEEPPHGALASATPPGQPMVLWVGLFEAMLAMMGPPPVIEDVNVAEEEFARLEKALETRHESWWESVSGDIWRPWATSLAARVRAIETFYSSQNHVSRMQEARTLGRQIIDWTKSRQGGYIFGLMAKDQPRDGSWTVEARRRLASMYSAFGSPPPAPVTPKKPAPEPEPEIEEGAPEPEAMLLPRLARQGLPIIIFGGEPSRSANVQKVAQLHAATKLQLEWVNEEDAERVAKRIRLRMVGGVIILDQLVGHSHAGVIKSAMDLHHVHFEYAKKGGLASLKTALRTLETVLECECSNLPLPERAPMSLGA